MGNLARLDLVSEGRGDMLLTYNIVKGLRSPLSVKHSVHGISLLKIKKHYLSHMVCRPYCVARC